MKNETSNDFNVVSKNYNLLKYFFENNIKIHIIYEESTFYNGEIKSLGILPGVMVLDERKNGLISIDLSKIKTSSITAFKEKQK